MKIIQALLPHEGNNNKLEQLQKEKHKCLNLGWCLMITVLWVSVIGKHIRVLSGHRVTHSCGQALGWSPTLTTYKTIYFYDITFLTTSRGLVLEGALQSGPQCNEQTV